MNSYFIEFDTYYLKSEYLKGLSGYDYIVLIMLLDANREIESNLLYGLLMSGTYKAMKKTTFLKCLERLRDSRLIKLKAIKNSDEFSCIIENRIMADIIYIERKVIDFLIEQSLKMVDLKVYLCILKDNYTKQKKIADAFGTKQSHISESIKRLCNASIIEIRKTKINGLENNRYFFNTSNNSFDFENVFNEYIGDYDGPF